MGEDRAPGPGQAPREDASPADERPRSGSTRLVVGLVRGLHGLNGAVRVEVLTDRPEDRFAIGNVLHLEGDSRSLTLTSAQAVEDGPGWRLRFAGISDRAAAERLRDAYLEIEVDRAADLPAGSAYWHEVVGSAVKDSTGAVLGRVADVYRAGATEVYVVRGGPTGEFDVPAVRDVITTFAPDRGELVIDETVLDLAAPPVDSPVKRDASKPRRRPRWSRHGKGAQVIAAPDASTAGAGPGAADANPANSGPAEPIAEPIAEPDTSEAGAS